MSLLPVAFFKKLMHKKTQAVRLPESESNRPRPEQGRTMVEVLMALLILGMISVGGYSGVKYALGLSQAWRGQAQINQLAKDIISLYAWHDSYATLSMHGRRGICNTIISPGNQDCVITSPWNQSVTVSKGNSNSSFKIVMHNTPKSICEHLSEMRFENVYMAQQECTSGSQDIEFVMDKNDRECSEGCPNGYSCVNGTCRAQDREDACNGIDCVGECLTGECRGGTCLRKQNGTACSIGICVNGTCTEETQPPETTTPSCNFGYFALSNGTCWPCNDTYGYTIDAASCAACDGTDSPRKMVNGECVLENCPDAYFRASDSYCYPCWSGSNISADESSCAACDNTSWPRTMVSGYCVQGVETTLPPETTTEESCGFGYFEDSDGDCVSCSDTSGYISDAAHCSACDSTSTPREMVNGYCALVTCPSGQFRNSNGYCRSCSSIGSYTSDAEHCSACDDTDYPREMLGSYKCALVTCPSGYFRDSDGYCYPCSDTHSRESDAEHCAACDNTSWPRQMLNGECVLKQGCADGQFEDSNGDCVSCSTISKISTDAENCTACDSTSTPREMVNGYCALENCPSGYFKDSNDNCHPCSTIYNYYESDAEHCSACNSTSTPRKMVNGYCALVTCPSGYFKDSDDNCHPCSADNYYGYATDAANCAVCDNTDYPREMTYDGMCKLIEMTQWAEECDFGYFNTESGLCYSCDTPHSWGADAASCAACDDTDYPREMVDNNCVLVNCPSGSFRDWYGCSPCSDTYAATSDAEHCSACEDVYPREMVNGYCVLVNCLSGSFRDSYGGCHSCDYLYDVESDAEHCAACDSTSTPRKMVGNYCRLASS